MKNTWSITESIYLYYSYDEERVFIANPESKKYYGPVKKISESVKDPELIKNDGHIVKFCEGKLKINLGGNWKTIGNIFIEDIVAQLSSVTIKDGEISGVIFGFKADCPENTLPLFPGSDYLKDAEKEFIRKINLTLYKKTTKYIPGHKYDCENGTYLYLGEVYSHMSSKNISKRYTTNKKGIRTVYIFTNDFEGIHDVEEFYTKYVINEVSSFPEDILEKTLFLISTKKTMVDLGEFMKIDPTFKPESVWEKRIKYFMDFKETYSDFSSLYRYSEIRGLFSGFDISSDLTPVVSDVSKDLIKNIIKNEFKFILYKYYDLTVNRNKYNIVTSDTIGDQAKALSSSFLYTNLRNVLNIYYEDYYREMIDILFGIYIYYLGEISIKEYKLLTISISDFNDLIENFGYLEYRSPENYIKTIDFVFINENKRNFETFLGNGLYRDIIKDIYKKAISNNGSELKEYSITNIGTPNRPYFEYNMSISLEDIIKYFRVKTIFDLPENFKNELVDKKIYKVIIKTREGIVIN